MNSTLRFVDFPSTVKLVAIGAALWATFEAPVLVNENLKRVRCYIGRLEVMVSAVGAIGHFGSQLVAGQGNTKGVAGHWKSI